MTCLRLCGIALILLVTASCGGGGGGGSVDDPVAELCTGYPSQATSPYLLPYPVGRTYLLRQGNCSTGGHGTGITRYAYDFEMDIGETITASRGGVVYATEEQYVDFDLTPSHENFVMIDHGDCTWGFYAHLTQFGALVEEGDTIAAGQDIGLSGHTGNSDVPHLHFQVAELTGANCEQLTGNTVATTFKNTTPHPNGLQAGQSYTALDPGSL